MLTENYKVVIVESDFFARNAINSYLARDRRTRVTHRLSSLDELFNQLEKAPIAELPDTILLDDTLLAPPDYAASQLRRIHALCQAHVLVLAHHFDEVLAKATRQAGGRGYVIRQEVGLQISWLVVWARVYPFVTTRSLKNQLPDAAILPEGREYPELTERVRQALMLCVVEGMSAQLAADEMGVSAHTIRTYIKEGYSILEANDDLKFPTTLRPQERAFMRLTAPKLNDLER